MILDFVSTKKQCHYNFIENVEVNNSDDTDDENDPLEFKNVVPKLATFEYDNLITKFNFPLKNYEYLSKFFNDETIQMINKFNDADNFFTSSTHQIKFLYTLPYSFLPFISKPINEWKLHKKLLLEEDNEDNDVISNKYDDITGIRSNNKQSKIKNLMARLTKVNLAKYNRSTVNLNNNGDQISNNNLRSNLENKELNDVKSINKEINKENEEDNIYICAPSYLNKQEIDFISKPQKVSNIEYFITKDGLTYYYDKTLAEPRDINSYFIQQQRFLYQKICNYRLVTSMKETKDIFKENLEIPLKVKEARPFLRRLLDFFIFWEPCLETLVASLEDEQVLLRKLNLLIAIGFHRVLASQGVPLNPILGETCEVKKNEMYIFAEVKKTHPLTKIAYNLRWRNRVVKLDGTFEFNYQYHEPSDELVIQLAGVHVLRFCLDFIDERPIYNTYTFNLPLKYSIRGVVDEIQNLGNSRAASVDSFVYIRGINHSSVNIFNCQKNDSEFWAFYSMITKEIFNFKEVLDNNHSFCGIIIHNLGLVLENVKGAEDHAKFIFFNKSQSAKLDENEEKKRIEAFKHKTKSVKKTDFLKAEIEISPLIMSKSNKDSNLDLMNNLNLANSDVLNQHKKRRSEVNRKEFLGLKSSPKINDLPSDDNFSLNDTKNVSSKYASEQNVRKGSIYIVQDAIIEEESYVEEESMDQKETTRKKNFNKSSKISKKVKTNDGNDKLRIINKNKGSRKSNKIYNITENSEIDSSMRNTNQYNQSNKLKSVFTENPNTNESFDSNDSKNYNKNNTQNLESSSKYYESNEISQSSEFNESKNFKQIRAQNTHNSSKNNSKSLSIMNIKNSDIPLMNNAIGNTPNPIFSSQASKILTKSKTIMKQSTTEEEKLDSSSTQKKKKKKKKPVIIKTTSSNKSNNTDNRLIKNKSNSNNVNSFDSSYDNSNNKSSEQLEIFNQNSYLEFQENNKSYSKSLIKNNTLIKNKKTEIEIEESYTEESFAKNSNIKLIHNSNSGENFNTEIKIQSTKESKEKPIESLLKRRSPRKLRKNSTINELNDNELNKSNIFSDIDTVISSPKLPKKIENKNNSDSSLNQITQKSNTSDEYGNLKFNVKKEKNDTEVSELSNDISIKKRKVKKNSKKYSKNKSYSNINTNSSNSNNDDNSGNMLTKTEDSKSDSTINKEEDSQLEIYQNSQDFKLLCPSTKLAYVNYFDYFRSDEFIKRFQKFVNFIHFLIKKHKLYIIFSNNFIYRIIFGSYLKMNFFEMKCSLDNDIIPVYLKLDLEVIDHKPSHFYNIKGKFNLHCEEMNFMDSHKKLYNNGKYWDPIYKPLPTDGIYREDFLWYFRYISAKTIKTLKKSEKLMVTEFLRHAFINAQYWNEVLEAYIYKNTNTTDHDFNAIK